jgi:hypothetical protein
MHTTHFYRQCVFRILTFWTLTPPVQKVPIDENALTVKKKFPSQVYRKIYGKVYGKSQPSLR